MSLIFGGTSVVQLPHWDEVGGIGRRILFGGGREFVLGNGGYCPSRSNTRSFSDEYILRKFSEQSSDMILQSTVTFGETGNGSTFCHFEELR